MKEICLEIIAHKALILCFNLTQCAQISYQGYEEKGDGEREMGCIHVCQEVKADMSLRVSLVNKMHFPNTEKRESKIWLCHLPFDSLVRSKGNEVAMR